MIIDLKGKIDDSLLDKVNFWNLNIVHEKMNYLKRNLNLKEFKEEYIQEKGKYKYIVLMEDDCKIIFWFDADGNLIKVADYEDFCFKWWFDSNPDKSLFDIKGLKGLKVFNSLYYLPKEAVKETVLNGVFENPKNHI